MKVWLIQRAEPTPLDNDGDQRILRTGLMARFFSEAGHEVTWFTSAFDHYNRTQRYDRTTRSEVSSNYIIQFLRSRGYSKNISFSRLLDEHCLAKEFGAIIPQLPKPDLIISSLPSVTMASKAASFAHNNGIPHVSDIRDLWPDVFLDIAPNAFHGLMRPALQVMRRSIGEIVDLSAVVTGITDQYVDWAMTYGTRTRSERDQPLMMAYMPSEISASSDFHSTGHTSRLNVSSEKLNAVFVGAVGPMMNFDPIVETAHIAHGRKLPIHFWMCGQGAALARLRERCSGLPNITWPGWIGANDIGYLLRNCEIGLLPYADLETFRNSIPNKFGEYLSGDLILALNLEDSAMARQLETTGSGFIYGDDPIKLTDWLERMAYDPESRERMKKSAANLYREKFHAPTVFSDFVDRMEALVDSFDPNRNVIYQ